jgi:hypothetical protein
VVRRRGGGARAAPRRDAAHAAWGPAVAGSRSDRSRSPSGGGGSGVGTVGSPGSITTNETSAGGRGLRASSSAPEHREPLVHVDVQATRDEEREREHRGRRQQRTRRRAIGARRLPRRVRGRLARGGEGTLSRFWRFCAASAIARHDRERAGPTASTNGRARMFRSMRDGARGLAVALAGRRVRGRSWRRGRSRGPHALHGPARRGERARGLRDRGARGRPRHACRARARRRAGAPRARRPRRRVPGRRAHGQARDLVSRGRPGPPDRSVRGPPARGGARLARGIARGGRARRARAGGRERTIDGGHARACARGRDLSCARGRWRGRRPIRDDHALRGLPRGLLVLLRAGAPAAHASALRARARTVGLVGRCAYERGGGAARRARERAAAVAREALSHRVGPVPRDRAPAAAHARCDRGARGRRAPRRARAHAERPRARRSRAPRPRSRAPRRLAPQRAPPRSTRRSSHAARPSTSASRSSPRRARSVCGPSSWRSPCSTRT